MSSLYPVICSCFALWWSHPIYAQAFRGGDTWCGNPETVQSPDNPYVKLAHKNVARARADRTSSFWLVWGATAPESKFRTDDSLRDEALVAYQKAVDKSVEKKETFWGLLINLESLRLWQRSDSPPVDQIEQWLAALKACVDLSYASNINNETWTSVAPNTLHQSAAILQLASTLYDEPKYADLAKKLVDTAAPMQEEDGAFRYIRQSGPSQVYFGFDSTFLGRYYQLSRDPSAKEQLIRMAGYSKDALANGLTEGSSSPWWKHHWGGGGPIHGVEIVAGLAHDPLTRSLAQYRLRYAAQAYMYSYYAMYFYDETIPSDTQLGADILRYNTNIGGPQLRAGPWQVVMPGKAYADTRIGISVATCDEPLRFDGYLNVAALPVLSGGTGNAYDRINSLIIAGTNALDARRCVVGENWIASAWTFHPRNPFFASIPEPEPGDWRLAQLWYADDHGVVGWLTVTATKDGKEAQPRGYVNMGHEIEIDSASPTEWASGVLHMKAVGTQVQSLSPIEIKDKTKSLWVNLANSEKEHYAAGDTYGYGLIAGMNDQPLYSLTSLNLGSGVLGFLIHRPGQPDVMLAYNSTGKSVQVQVGKEGCWRSTTPQGGRLSQAESGPMSLVPGELVVIP